MDAYLNFEEVPSPLDEFKVYRAKRYPWHFVICCEMKMGKGFEDWTGYTATYKSIIGSKNKVIRIDGLWNNLDDAKKACEDRLRQLKQ